MTLNELTECLTYLGIVFNKSYTPEECKIYYAHLKDHDYQTFKKEVKEYAVSNDYAPTLRQLVDTDKPRPLMIDEKVNVNKLIELRDRLKKELGC